MKHIFQFTNIHQKASDKSKRMIITVHAVENYALPTLNSTFQTIIGAVHNVYIQNR